MPTNALISFIQKAMIYVYLEYHTDENTGNKVPCDETFSLFRKHNCYRKVGNNSGFPNEKDEKGGDIDLDNKTDPYSVSDDFFTSQIFVGPPHRRFQDKWLLSGFYNLYSLENTLAALTNWNPSIESQLLTISIGGPSFVSYEIPNKGYDYKLLSLPSNGSKVNINSTIGCFRHDGNVLATGYEDGRCCIWSNDAALLDTLKPFDCAVTAMAFSGNPLNPEMNDDQTERLSIAGVDGSLSIYELETDGSFRIRDTSKFPNCIVHIAWRDHATLSLVANGLDSHNTYISLYDTTTFTTTNITPVSQYTNDVTEGNTSSNVFVKTIWDKEGTSVALVGDVLYIYQHSANSFYRLDHRDKVIDADWVYGFTEKASKRIVTCSADKLVTLWDVINKCIINTALLDHIPTCMSLCKNNAVLAVATFGAILKIYALPGLILKFSIQESKPITHISWSSDNTSVSYNLYKTGGTVVLPLRIFTQYE